MSMFRATPVLNVELNCVAPTVQELLHVEPSFPQARKVIYFSVIVILCFRGERQYDHDMESLILSKNS